MNKKILLLSAIALSALTFAQVGINTETPSATLDIVSSGNDNTTKALEINNSAATEMVTVLDNGNMGIGTATPTEKLDVQGKIFTNNAFGSATTGALTYLSDSGRLVLSPTTGTTTNGSMIILRGTTNTAGGAVAGTLQLRVHGDGGAGITLRGDNGSVGIGHNVPDAKLRIRTRGNTSATKALFIENSSGTNLLTILDDGSTTVGKLSTGATTDAVVTADANGLLNKLTLTDVSRFAEPWYEVSSGTTATGIAENIYHTGRVSVGNTTSSEVSPLAPLKAVSTGTGIQLTLERSGEATYTQMGSDANGFQIWPSGYANGIKFFLGSNGRAKIGGGPSTPNATLDVAGTIKIADDATGATVGGACTVAGQITFIAPNFLGCNGSTWSAL